MVVVATKDTHFHVESIPPNLGYFQRQQWLRYKQHSFSWPVYQKFSAGQHVVWIYSKLASRSVRFDLVDTVHLLHSNLVCDTTSDVELWYVYVNQSYSCIGLLHGVPVLFASLDNWAALKERHQSFCVLLAKYGSHVKLRFIGGVECFPDATHYNDAQMLNAFGVSGLHHSVADYRVTQAQMTRVCKVLSVVGLIALIGVGCTYSACRTRSHNLSYQVSTLNTKISCFPSIDTIRSIQSLEPPSRLNLADE